MVALRLISFSFHKAGVGFVISEYRASTVPKTAALKILIPGGFCGKIIQKGGSKPSVFCTFPGENVRESNKREIRWRSAVIIYIVSARLSPKRKNGMIIANVLK